MQRLKTNFPRGNRARKNPGAIYFSQHPEWAKPMNRAEVYGFTDL